MIEKTQMLVTHLKHSQFGLALVANISGNVTTIKVYDTCEEDSLKLYVAISNLWNIEEQLCRLWIEVNGLLQEYVKSNQYICFDIYLDIVKLKCNTS